MHTSYAPGFFWTLQKSLAIFITKQNHRTVRLKGPRWEICTSRVTPEHIGTALCPDGSWVSPARETPHPDWAMCSSAWSPAQQSSSSCHSQLTAVFLTSSCIKACEQSFFLHLTNFCPLHCFSLPLRARILKLKIINVLFLGKKNKSPKCKEVPCKPQQPGVFIPIEKSQITRLRMDHLRTN